MRLLPWLQEAARRDKNAVGYMLDCRSCKRRHSRQVRQMLRCGLEPPLDVATMQIRPEAWQHQAFEPMTDEHGHPIPVSTCPGYTCALPDVLEVARARLHWSKGQLALFTNGEKPSENLLRGIEILDGESHRVEAWLATPRDKGGGGP